MKLPSQYIFSLLNMVIEIHYNSDVVNKYNFLLRNEAILLYPSAEVQ